MTTEEAIDFYNQFNLNNSFSYYVVVIGHTKENLKYRTNIRTNIHYKDNIIDYYDGFIDGRKNVITNTIKNTQKDLVFDRIIEYIKSSIIFKNLIDSHRLIEQKRIETKEKILDNIESVYWAFDADKDYKSTFNISFPNYRKNIDNLDVIETIFDDVHIIIDSKYDINIVEFNTGSVIRNDIERRRLYCHLKEVYLETLEQFSKIIKHEILSYTLFFTQRTLDLKMNVTLKLIRHSYLHN
jgi:hypothetical protein